MKESFIRMKESHFNTEIRKSFEHLGGYAYKIPDMPHGAIKGMRFNPDKPCDIMVGWRGIYFGIEGKIIKKLGAFGDQIRESQIKGLDAMVASGNSAFVFLNVRINGDEGGKRVNQLVIFDWVLWGPKFKQGTIKKADLIEVIESQGIKGQGGLFDLRGFLNGVLHHHLDVLGCWCGASSVGVDYGCKREGAKTAQNRI